MFSLLWKQTTKTYIQIYYRHIANVHLLFSTNIEKDGYQESFKVQVY